MIWLVEYAVAATANTFGLKGFRAPTLTKHKAPFLWEEKPRDADRYTSCLVDFRAIKSREKLSTVVEAHEVWVRAVVEHSIVAITTTQGSECVRQGARNGACVLVAEKHCPHQGLVGHTVRLKGLHVTAHTKPVT